MSSISKTTATSSCSSSITTTNSDDEGGLRRGPWTLEEDTLLIHYISSHGEGRWNLLAKRSGLKRTGKSCRLRWLNYLKPDVKRGNLSPQEQLLILDLHFKWGNRWSKIAQHLPGRTDNEIKNYWRTRVQKQARHLKIDPNSNQFQELIRCVWMPRLIQKIHAQSSSSSSPTLITNNNNNQLLCNSLAAVPQQQQQLDSDVVLFPPYNNPSFPAMDDKDNASRSSLSRMSSSSSSSSSFTSAVNSEHMPFQSESYDMETLFTVIGGGSNDHHVLYSEDQNQWLATDEFIYGSLWNNMELDDELSQFQER